MRMRVSLLQQLWKVRFMLLRHCVRVYFASATPSNTATASDTILTSPPKPQIDGKGDGLGAGVKPCCNNFARFQACPEKRIHLPLFSVSHKFPSPTLNEASTSMVKSTCPRDAGGCRRTQTALINNLISVIFNLHKRFQVSQSDI